MSDRPFIVGNWKMHGTRAMLGEARAIRRLGEMVLAGKAPASVDRDPHRGVRYLKEAALNGDYRALISLEKLRQKNLSHSPALEDIIDIEKERAETGDPVVAWRLAKRYRLGDGVEISSASEALWLEPAAAASPKGFPHANKAAFRLCELSISGASPAVLDVADLHWCEIASERGDPAARIILGRIATLFD